MDFTTRENVLADFDIQEEREPSIISQYSASPRIMALIYAFRARLDPSADIDLFFRDVFDLVTASGWSLDNWGRILGIGRYLTVPGGDYFGFQDIDAFPFDQAPFLHSGATERYALFDDAYHRLLWYKAMANIAPTNLAALNSLLRILFEGRQVFVLDNLNMTIRAVFGFYLEPYEIGIFRSYGLLARAGGVGFEWLQIRVDETFGFAGSDLQPFNQGVFLPYGLQTGLPGLAGVVGEEWTAGGTLEVFGFFGSELHPFDQAPMYSFI